MRVTTVAPYVPHARIPHAGGQYLYRYLGELSKGAGTSLVAPDTPANRSALAGAPGAVDVHLFAVPAQPRLLAARAVRYARAAADGLSLGLGEVGAFARDAPAEATIAGSDVVEVHWSEMLPLVPRIQAWAPRARVVAFEYDVRYQSLSRRAGNGDRLRDRALATVAARRVRRREPAYLNRCAAVLTFTRKDADLLRQLGVRAPIDLLAPSLVLPPPPWGPAAEPTVLFVGAFDRPENSEGAIWFLDEAWPAVKAACPEATLVLAGANPPAALRRRASEDVRVTGFVEDLDPAYRAARVAVCPMLSGGGLKFKVPQAMLYGVPVVATSVAAEGIVGDSGPSAFAVVSDDPASLAAAVVRCLVDRAAAEAIGGRGREWAVQAYRFEDSVPRVMALYRRLLSSH